MSKQDWIKVILIISLFGNVTLFMNHERESKRLELKFELLNAYIYRDLTQLEVTIQQQMDSNWATEPLVSQKLDDAIDSVILHTGLEEDDDKEQVLWKLHDYLKAFKVSDDPLPFTGSLTAKQRTHFIELGEKLRSSGWNYNVGYDTKWDVFESKVNGLIAGI